MLHYQATAKTSSVLKSSIKLFALLAAFACTSCNNSNKIGYVDINMLYESFDYKKEVTLDYNRIKTARDKILDSMEMNLNILAKTLENTGDINKESQDVFEARRNEYYTLVKQFDQDNQVLVSTYNDKVLKQLNAYIKEYGKKNSYRLIVGADNKGSILYGDEKLDITKQIIEFINKRYGGDKK